MYKVKLSYLIKVNLSQLENQDVNNIAANKQEKVLKSLPELRHVWASRLLDFPWTGEIQDAYRSHSNYHGNVCALRVHYFEQFKSS